MVFITDGFSEVAIESCPEWDLNPRPLNSVHSVHFKYILTNLIGGNVGFSNIFTWPLKISKALCYKIIKDTNSVDPGLKSDDIILDFVYHTTL